MEETDHQNLRVLLICMGLILGSTVCVVLFSSGLFGPKYSAGDLVQDSYIPVTSIARIEYFDKSTDRYAYTYIFKWEGKWEYDDEISFMAKNLFEERYRKKVYSLPP